ncbi:MAG TPA: ATP-dependent DNA helicase [Candidatus Magasanikbacteria bacterium]|nr:ATP-dependent DNA helicase [Candidatus Magasanikbacteria bacterium]
MSKNTLNKAQKTAIEYVDGPLMIVAGAGTGKTTVITKKIAHILENKLATPEQILALTFNEKAAAEMQERLDEMLSIGYTEMQISTFHAFAEKILENYGLDIGLSNQFKILTETDAWLLMKKNLDKFNLDYYRPLGNPVRHIHELIKHFSKCKDELITPEKYLEYAENLKLDKDNVEIEEKTRLSEVANAYHVYNRLLLDSNALDFGDLIYYSVELLKKRKNILQQFHRRFKYILVDEFQDVNYAQYELVKILVEGGAQLTVVGDDDQSIYAFRGANVSNILRFKEDFKNCKEVVLTENYRSGQEILDVAYKSVANNNPDRLEVKLNIDKRLVASGEIKTGEVIHAHLETLDDEAKFVIDEIKKIKEKNKDVTWDDFAILVRANSHADPFINLLQNFGIPYEFLSSSGLFRQEVVLDCYNFFKAIDGYHENTAIYRILRLPFLEVSENDLQKMLLFAKRKTVSYYEALKRGKEYGLGKEGEKIFAEILDFLHEGMKQQKSEKPTRILYNFLENSGYLKFLARGEQEGNREVIRRIYQLKQYFDYVQNFEKMVPGAKVSDFVAHFADVLDAGDLGVLKQPQESPDSVNIMTVHMSKGLEFKYVFVVNLVEDRFPTRKRNEGIDMPIPLLHEQMPEGDYHLQEERRLFYVAITRAKEKLYLLSGKNYGGSRDKKISRFLNELGYTVGKYDKKKSTSALPKLEKVNEEKGKFIYDLPKSFSFSQISSYEDCPYQYKLKNILQLQIKGGPQFSFGQSMHSTLQKFYIRIKDLNSAKQESLFGLPEKNSKIDGEIKVPTLEELLKMYEESFIDDWYNSAKQREDYFLRGKEILRDYYRVNEGKWTVPVALEQRFKYKLGKYLISGRIDRIDMTPDKKLKIVDYKTGNPKEKLETEDKNQLLIYQLALSSLPEFKNLGEVNALTYLYLSDQSELTFIGTEKELEKIKEKITEIIDAINSGNFEAEPSKFTCARCDFRDICEFRE